MSRRAILRIALRFFCTRANFFAARALSTCPLFPCCPLVFDLQQEYDAVLRESGGPPCGF